MAVEGLDDETRSCGRKKLPFGPPTPWRERLSPVPLRRDGLPQDSKKRRAVLNLIMGRAGGTGFEWCVGALAYELSGRPNAEGADRNSHDSDAGGPQVIAALEIIKSMVDHGRFALVHVNRPHYDDRKPFCIDFSPSRKRGTTPEEQDENFEAVIKAVGDRTCETAGGQALMSYLFRLYRYLYAARIVETDLGRGVLVASRIGMEADVGPVVVEGCLFVVQAGGIVCYTAPEGSIAMRWDRWKPVISVDPERIVVDEAGTASVAKMPLLPSSKSENCAATRNASEALRRAYRVKELMPHRRAASVYVEEDICLDRWRGVASTLSKVRSIDRSLRIALFSALEPDVRKAALRDPQATYSLYNWFAAGGGDRRLRRLQASESFPIASRILPTVEKAVDDGYSLIEALSEATGMSKAQVRDLRSVYWQTVGARNLGAALAMAGVPQERMPTSKKDWQQVSEIVGQKINDGDWISLLPIEVRRKFMKAASSDWSGYRDLLMHRDFLRAVADMAESLAPLVTGRLTAERCLHTPIFVMIFVMVGGESFGLKRLRKFGDAWHAGVSRRVAIERTIKKKAFGNTLSRWPALAGDFANEFGEMRWLLDEDQLAAEGLEMGHCVGSYVDDCVQGGSYIASFRGSDGSRSTAEFFLDRGKIKPAQHKAHFNREPVGDVTKVYDAFLKHVSRKKFKDVRGVSGEDIRKGLWIPAQDEPLEAIIRMWVGSLPEECLTWNRDRWRAEARRYALPDDGFPEYDDALGGGLPQAAADDLGDGFGDWDFDDQADLERVAA